MRDVRPPSRPGSSEYSEAAWATGWKEREGWMHRVRVLEDFRREGIDYRLHNCTLSELARDWKSHLAESDAAMDKKPDLGV